eukprot:TCONS_00068820-protein
MSAFKKEFKCSNFGLSYHCVGDFYRPQCIPQIALLVIRVIIALYTTASMLADMVDFFETKSNGGCWFVFFTSWNYLTCVFYFILVTIGTISYYSKKRQGCDPDVPMSSMNPNQYASTTDMLESGSPDLSTESEDLGNRLSCYDKIIWLFFNISIAVCTLVVASYWIVLFDGSQDLDFFNIDRHGIILAMVLIDFSLHRIPYRVLHFVYPMIFFILYFIFHVIYSFASEDVIYSPINWQDNPTKAGILFLVIIVLSGVFHFVFYWIDYGKKLLGERCCQTNTMA